MSAPASAPAGSLPRADAAGTGPVRRGFFAFGSTSLHGLPWTFWALQAYFFLGTSAIDEEWQAIGRFSPRLILGVLILATVVSRALSASMKADVSGKRLAREDNPAARLLAAPGAKWLLAFLVAGFLSTMWAFEPSIALAGQREHATRVLSFFLLVGTLRSRREVLVTVLVFAAGHGFYLLRSFTEYLAGKYDFQMGVRRMLGAGKSYQDPNSFAATVVLALPLVAWAAIRSRSAWLKFCALAYGGLGGVCVLLTRSRSGLVLISLATLWAIFSIRSTWPKVVLILGIAALAGVLASGQTEAEKKRYASVFSLFGGEDKQDESTRGRVTGYEVGWRMFTENPVLGVGPNCWAAYRTRRVDGNPLEPHNLAGLLIATRGLLGTIPFVGWVLTALATAGAVWWRRRRATDPWDSALAGLGSVVLVSFFLLLVSGLAAHNLDRPTWYVLPGLLAAALWVKPDEADKGVLETS